MTYTRYFLKEVLRVRSPVPNFWRDIKETFEVRLSALLFMELIFNISSTHLAGLQPTTRLCILA